MLNAMLLALFSVAAAPAPTDTTFAVEPHGRLHVDNPAGVVRVRTWNRDQIRVRVSGNVRPRIRSAGPAVYIESTGATRGARAVDYEITVPAGYGAVLDGLALNADVAGLAGEVVVRTTTGGATVRGGQGPVRIETVAGRIIIDDVRGDVTARTSNGDITLRRVTGDIAVESVNGAIRLEDIHANSVDAGTVNGAVVYRGVFANGGRYRFGTHNGAITIAVAPASNASVFVSLLNGDFDAAFPVSRQAGGDERRFSFIMGNGSARVELESFNGRIRLTRP